LARRLGGLDAVMKRMHKRVDGRKIKMNLERNNVGGCGPDSSGLEQGLNVGSCDRGKETYVSIKG
jgi:hypothetical protein